MGMIANKRHDSCVDLYHLFLDSCLSIILFSVFSITSFQQLIPLFLYLVANLPHLFINSFSTNKTLGVQDLIHIHNVSRLVHDRPSRNQHGTKLS